MRFKKLVMLVSIFASIVNFGINAHAANFMHTFSDEEWQEISRDDLLIEKEFDATFNEGPGYEILKEKYGTDDFSVILDNEDKNYGVTSENTKTVIAPENVKSGTCSDDGYKASKRDKKIERMVAAEAKKAEKEASDEEDESIKGSKKIRISVVIEKDHPNNPTPGQTYTKTHIIYTDCDNLGDAMREAEITNDSGFITYIDGINGSYTIENGIFGWKGYSWMLYENGRLTSVGADSLPIKDGTMVRWRAEYVEMTW